MRIKIVKSVLKTQKYLNKPPNNVCIINVGAFRETKRMVTTIRPTRINMESHKKFSF